MIQVLWIFSALSYRLQLKTKQYYETGALYYVCTILIVANNIPGCVLECFQRSWKLSVIAGKHVVLFCDYTRGEEVHIATVTTIT